MSTRNPFVSKFSRADILAALRKADELVESVAYFAGNLPDDGHKASQDAAWAVRRELWGVLNTYDEADRLARRGMGA